MHRSEAEYSPDAERHLIHLEKLQFLLDNLTALSNSILKDPTNSSPYLRSSFTELLEGADRAVRRFHICRKEESEGFDEAVWWMSERGNNTDVQMLAETRSSLEVADPSKAELLRVAEDALKERLSIEKGEVSALSRQSFIAVFLTIALVACAVSLAVLRPHQFTIARAASVFVSLIMGFGSSALLLLRGVDPRRIMASQVFMLASGIIMLLETMYILHAVVFH